MSKKQTAVEWLLDWMEKNQYFIGNDLLQAVEQAKEMEIKQAHEYAEFAIRCDRKDMKILNFDGYINFKNSEQ